MASQTTNYKLKKPGGEDYYDINVHNDNMDIIDQAMTDFDAQIAEGTATAITIVLKSINKYRAGMKVTIVASRDNGGAATTLKLNTLESKPIYKPNSTTAPKLTSGKPYTFILSSDLSCFFLDASAAGDAVAANVLAGKIFSNDDDIGLTGTMVNNGAAAITPGMTNQAIPAGYHNGSGVVSGDPDLVSANIKAGINIFGVVGNSNVVDTSAGDATAAQILSSNKAYVKGALVTGTIPSKTATTITPGTADQTIVAGQYLSGAQTISGDSDLVSANIKAGINIFGVVGNSNVVDTSAGDATAAQILSSNKAYVKGALVTGTITSKSAATITPGTTDQTIAAGQYLSGAQTISGDSDLVSANIRAGINIFGVGGNSNVVNTSAGDAVAANILSGKKAYVGGALVTGTMSSKVGSGTVISPSTSEQAIPAGYYGGALADGKISAISLAAGDNLLAYADGYAGFYGTTMGKMKEIVVNASGTVRVKFDLMNGNGGITMQAQIYKNGEAVGTLRSITSGTTTFTEDITIASGDLIQVYAKTEASGMGGYILNFRLYTKLPNIVCKVNKDT